MWTGRHRFAVIVCASGHWIRDAFTRHYEVFDRRDSDNAVHDLGADFLQKIFDHSVLVPNLSPEQTEDLIHVVSGSRYYAAPPRPPRQIRAAPTGSSAEPKPDAEAGPDADTQAGRRRGTGMRSADGPRQVDQTTAAADPPPLSGAAASATAADQGAPSAAPATDPAEVERRQQERIIADTRAARDDLGVEAKWLITHLLTNYAHILPNNPRLIIRVASAWAMLRAVARSINLQRDGEPANDLLVRAAVIWVRFPVLADELLDADEPPVIDPENEGCSPRWRRRDVQQVLTMKNDQLLDIEDLALYYGKFYAKPVRQQPVECGAHSPAGPPAASDPDKTRASAPPPRVGG